MKIKLFDKHAHCRLTPPPRKTLAIIRMYLTFLETRTTGLHFAADSLGLSSFTFFWWAP